MRLPDSLESFRPISDRYLKEDRVSDLSFSGPTYQVAVVDIKTNNTMWVFLQLDDGSVKDLFCSCEASTENNVCEHMAAACQFLSRREEPPHCLYVHSFWRALFYQLFLKCKIPSKPQQEGCYSITTKKGKAIGCIKAATKLPIGIEKPKQESEENSIKFSNLSEEELHLWRQGRPTIALQYELSSFSDIAKLLCFEQWKGGPYSITFLEEQEDKLPTKVIIESTNICIEVTLDKEDYIAIIPTLSTVKTNLPLLTRKTATIRKMVYQEKEGTIQVFYDKVQPQISLTEGHPIGNWVYVPHKGFYDQKKAQPFRETVLYKEEGEIERLLLDADQEKIEPLILDKEPRELSYTLWMDKSNALHVEAFLFAPHDLSESLCRRFGSFVYVQGVSCKKGFFRIMPPRFSCLHLVIPKASIASFVMEHQGFMTLFEEFTVHVMKIEEAFSYTVDKHGTLTFHKKPRENHISNCDVDLGKMVYRPGVGFFVKQTVQQEFSLPETPIAATAVPYYIQSNRSLCSMCSSFFMRDAPIQKMGLYIHLKRRALIEITPEYEWMDPQDARNSFFFDDFVFVQKKGFYELPPHLKPPYFAREISHHDAELWNAFFTEILPKLKLEYSCRIDPRLETAKELSLVIKQLGESDDKEKVTDWVFELYFQSMKARVNLYELIKAAQDGVRFHVTDCGVIDLATDRFRFLATFASKKVLKKHRLTLSPADFFHLQTYGNIDVDAPSVQKNIIEKLLACQTEVEPQLQFLRSELRPYQKLGVDWLYFLYKNSLSGMLCDDMGVGKTHQAMGLIAAILAEKKTPVPLFLIICPTSLIYHWKDKLERYLPNIKIKIYTETGRTLADFPGEGEQQLHLILTTYGIWRSDCKKFRRLVFDIAIFDELQIAKNHISQIYAALLQVRAAVKIGLTGTPIENQLRELKALFDIVLPGYMPTEGEFRDFFVRPIEKENNIERRRLLSRFVHPFILRRKKQDVLPELPEKSEDIYYAELLGEQKNLYRQVAQAGSYSLIQLLHDEAQAIPYMHIFALLSALKQICNHPAAYLKDIMNYEHYESGKWEAFTELLEEAEESQQKVVVFSQYLAMLDIIEHYLTKKNIGFAGIRGQTKDRGGQVERFTNDPSCRVFLGSLQAAGLGIDLTAASIVIHYDRWWNPARENQATDRVHRLGQSRGVQVFKLLTRHSVEERIDAMIAHKQSLLENIVSFDDHQIMRRLSRNEILALLEGL